MRYEIKHRFTEDILFSLECASFRFCVEAAVKDRTNLSDANLSGADLTRAYLTRAYLSDANLSGAYLTRANLSDANLSGANLTRANLSDANLSDAYLACANLSGADLAGAYLTRANLARANLTRANLTRANLTRANLARANLARADRVIGLGYPNGWSAIAWFKDGVVRVQVGCRNLTLAQARTYWAGKPDRREIMAALDYAERIAELRGWMKKAEEKAA